MKIFLYLLASFISLSTLIAYKEIRKEETAPVIKSEPTVVEDMLFYNKVKWQIKRKMKFPDGKIREIIDRDEWKITRTATITRWSDGSLHWDHITQKRLDRQKQRRNR